MAARDPDQDGEGRVRGVELEGRMTPFEGFSLIGAATWMDSEMTRSDQYQGKQLIMVPDYTASFWADYTFAGGALTEVTGKASTLSVSGGRLTGTVPARSVLADSQLCDETLYHA